MSEFIAEDVVDGQRVITTKNVDGNVQNYSSTLAEVLVDVGSGVMQRCIAVKDFGGGGGGSIDYSRVIEKQNSIPTASAEYNNRICIYGGETNETYTHGYIYECKQKTTYTGTVSFNPASISGTVVSCSGDDFANFLTESGVSPLTVVSGTITYDVSGNLWILVGKDSNNNTVMTFQEYTEDYEDFGFTFTGNYVNGDVISFICAVSDESSTYVWERIDVQPTETDYLDLENKPQINGVALSGNKTSSDLGLQAELESGTNIKTINGQSVLGNGNISFDDYYRSLSSEQATTLLSTGTYNDEEVDNGEIFNCADGSVKQYKEKTLANDTITTINNFPFKQSYQQNPVVLNGIRARYVGGGSGGYVVSADKTNWVFKDNYGKNNGGIVSVVKDDTLYLFNYGGTPKTVSTTKDFDSWTNENVTYGYTSAGAPYDYGYVYNKFLLCHAQSSTPFGYQYSSDGKNWTFVSDADKRLFIFSDGVIGIDKTTKKIYTTTDLGAEWVDSGETSDIPSVYSDTQQITILNDVVFLFDSSHEKMYVSTDRCKTFVETNMLSNIGSTVYAVEMAYCSSSDKFIAIPSTGSYETNLYCVSDDGEDWQQKSGDVNVVIMGVWPDGIVTASSSDSYSATANNVELAGLQRSLDLLNVEVGVSAPTSSTVGYVGKIYIDGSGNAYICVGSTGLTYSWMKVTLTSI